MAIQATETTVAEGPTDFLEAKHVVLRGANREIGRALAEITRNQFDVQLQLAPDPVVLGALREYLQGHYPIHYQRMLGVADAYELTADDPRFDSSGLAYLFELPGCSSAFIPAGQESEQPLADQPQLRFLPRHGQPDGRDAVKTG